MTNQRKSAILMMVKLYKVDRGANGKVASGCKGRQGPMSGVNVPIAESRVVLPRFFLGAVPSALSLSCLRMKSYWSCGINSFFVWYEAL